MKIITLQRMLCVMFLFTAHQLLAQETQWSYLSGTGNDKTVNWKFFCTAGHNSGKWTTIPVPSNWELQGFGTYNYGWDKDSVRGMEKGLYQYSFKVAEAWKDKTVNIVFEGSMTDTEVKINGKRAGAIHQGSFYQFRYNITDLLHYGKSNLLEVTVAKHSANNSVNEAERRCDYWIFGGIYRPVYLEALPAQHIKRVAINAAATGKLDADVYIHPAKASGDVSIQLYTTTGAKVGNPQQVRFAKGDSLVHIGTSVVSPQLWSPEYPNLYKAVFSLQQNGQTVHLLTQRFGFRTVELRERDGIYVNGTRIKFKGVCHHSFWPSSGRTTSKAISIADVELIKDMNMNAIRMTHYPPDTHLLEVCDSLGLFVLDELAGWHHTYDTKVGSVLLEEMVARDVNHPSVVIWDNGNEGGHNFDFDPLFDQNDIQKRPVIHPWQVFRGTDTQHYINYDYGNGSHLHGHDVTFPTEFLHGLYDGGHGAGLEDYWEWMWNSPLSAGGFLWVFADEGVVRTDKNGLIDVDGSHAPDGILGPYHEKEASFYTIKEVWSPIFIEHRDIAPGFDGTFRLQNRYFYTNVKECTFGWKLARMASPKGVEGGVPTTGTATAPDIAPGQFGRLSLALPDNWNTYDVLYLTARDRYNRELYTWSWPIARPAQIAKTLVTKTGTGAVKVTETDSLYTVIVKNVEVVFSRKTGLLKTVNNGKGNIPFGNGPILCEGVAAFESVTYRTEGDCVVVESKFEKKSSLKEAKWTIYPSGWVGLDIQYFPVDELSTMLGVTFSYPEKMVKGARLMGSGPYRVWKNRIKGTTLNVWDKTYNNTVTGESQKLEYPEFKGYYANFYWVKLETTGQPLTIVCNDEDVFLHLFTPQSPKEAFNVAPAFPSGDISFMQGITPIGTKSQKPENMGPMGKKNMYFDYWKDRSKAMSLWFDFSGGDF